MLRWLLVLMALGVLWTSSVQGLAPAGGFVEAARVSTVVLPSDSKSLELPGRVTAWLFKNADSVPKPRVAEESEGGVLTAGLVSKALPARSGRVSKPWQPPASAVWLLVAFGALLVAVASAAWWWQKPGG
ncbi:hypothetical protein HYV43_04865 [Candidatus Micrarchaeota archaeon]|nr:hypothetical protein [Candidatus Micrarchaeota archaeon]